MDDRIEAVALLPCPFCGNPVETDRWEVGKVPVSPGVRVVDAGGNGGPGYWPVVSDMVNREGEG